MIPYKNYTTRIQIWFVGDSLALDQKIYVKFKKKLASEAFKRLTYYDLTRKAITFLQEEKISEMIHMDSDYLARFIVTLSKSMRCYLYHLPDSQEIDFELD